MKQKVLYYSDELNDELAPATIQFGMHVHYLFRMY